MEMYFLTKIASDEVAAEKYLRERGVLKTFTECPYCGSKHFGKVRRNSYKCYRCKKEWSPRKGSILENSKVSFTKFLIVLKLFELEVSVLKASKEAKLAYRTTYRLYELIRKRIYQETTRDDILSGEIEMDESYFGGRRKGKRGRGARNKIRRLSRKACLYPSENLSSNKA